MSDDAIRARDLMRTEFSTVCVDETLGDAMVELRDAQSRTGIPNALMIVDAQGLYVGMLTAKLLVRVLVEGADEGGDLDDDALLMRARDRLARPVGGHVVEIPAVTTDDRLLTMIRRGLPNRLDFVPVVEEGKPVGFAPITAIFQAAAGIALTPEHEGIRFDR